MKCAYCDEEVLSGEGSKMYPNYHAECFMHECSSALGIAEPVLFPLRRSVAREFYQEFQKREQLRKQCVRMENDFNWENTEN